MAVIRRDPPAELLEKILKTIKQNEQQMAYQRSLVFLFILVASAVALIPTVRFMLKDLETSDFMTFFSLLFSDFSIVTQSWQTFSMAMLESFPAISISIVLALVVLLILSIATLRKNLPIFLKTI